MTKEEALIKIENKQVLLSQLKTSELNIGTVCNFIKTALDCEVLQVYVQTEDDMYKYIKDDIKENYNQCIDRVTRWYNEGKITLYKNSDPVQQHLLEILMKLTEG